MNGSPQPAGQRRPRPLSSAMQNGSSGGKRVLPSSSSARSESPSSGKSGNGNVFARLQALFPNSPSTPAESTAMPPTGRTALLSRSTQVPLPTPALSTPLAPAVTERDFLKIKIVTWNMHDSLPKGNLSALLGVVPAYEPLEVFGSKLPQLPPEDAHPYHLVVVAGQECPTHSGLPMGIDAGLKPKHRDKEKHHEREAARRERERQRRAKDGYKPEPSGPGAMSGWSTILEDWFQEGLGAVVGAQPALADSPTQTEFNFAVTAPPMETSISAPAVLVPTQATPETPIMSWKVPAEGGEVTLSPEQVRAKAGGRKGPYVLLTKERLMGIYVAIYIHRDCRKLVQDYSQATVTTGLIGGRVGNKGACGISMNLAGTRLLFINAHLAAHEGKVPLRLANLLKIQTELEVDSFLSSDDPRLLEEDVTDRFDYTFICGDLNFRLDVSRLHADWLIARKEYAQALEFDQLRPRLSSGEIDFQEGEINFPPTYKYDVKRRSVARRPTYRRRATADNIERVPEAEEPAATEKEDDDHDEDEPPRRDFESSSFVSTGTGYTSMASTVYTTEAEDEEDEDGVMATSLAAAAQAAQKLLSHPTAQKAKTKVLGFLQSRTASSQQVNKRMSITPDSQATPTNETPPLLNPPSATSKPGLLRSASSRTQISLRINNDDDVPNSYDSSTKQRVPSWCDRILWKSTVEPDPEAEAEPAAEGLLRRGSFRRGYFGSALANALARKPARRDSASTQASSSHEDSPGVESEESMAASLPSPPPLMRLQTFPEPQGRPSPQRRARQSSQATAAPPLFKSTMTDANNVLSESQSKRPRLSFSYSTPSSPSISPLASSPPRLPPVFVEEPLRMPNLTVPDDPSAPSHQRSGSGGHSSARRWFLHLPALLSRSSIHDATPSATAPAAAPKHRRGEVVCLSYNTLDDAQMRELEARSDHRPVIGSYAVYI